MSSKNRFRCRCFTLRLPRRGILAAGKFDFALLHLQTSPDDAMALFACDQRALAGFNFWQYCNPNVDADFVRASTFDRARRTRFLSQVQHALLRDAAFDPLYRIDTLWASGPVALRHQAISLRSFLERVRLDG